MTYFYERKLGFTPNEFGMLDVLGYIVSIIGTLIYKRWLREVSFPKIFFWALLLSFILENTLLLLVFHTNRVIGIPDFVFALIERIVLTLVGQFISMPMVVLGARVCPVGVEGTLYALLMSITNFGDVVSSEWGSMFTSMFVVLLIGTPFIKFFSARQILNPIRDDGPSDHIIKKIGTPTMGGVLILLGLFSGILLWGDLTNYHIWFLLFIVSSYGSLGLKFVLLKKT